jgi:hypothetical protein
VAKLEFFPRTEFLRGVATVTVFRDHIHGQLSASPAHGWFDSFTFWILAAEWNRRCRRFFGLERLCSRAFARQYGGELRRKPPLVGFWELAENRSNEARGTIQRRAAHGSPHW